ncbi:MAG TPA: DUF559 domain-containing protein [Acidimicrobiales bacterium]|nr:DUF559 domain-containing protein [Acidimicrobiales bacterium]
MDGRLRELAERQHGVVARRQARGVGLRPSPSSIPRKRRILAIDSDLHHTSLLDKAADADRDAALAAAGYTVVRIKEHEVWHRPDEVVRRLLAS